MLHDERLTTVTADRAMLDAGLRPKNAAGMSTRSQQQSCCNPGLMPERMAMRSDLLSDNQRARNRWDDDEWDLPDEVPHVDRAPGRRPRPLVGVGGALACSRRSSRSWLGGLVADATGHRTRNSW